MKWLIRIMVIGFLLGCGKEEELSPPSIDILTPSGITNFAYGDTILFTCMVSAPYPMESVRTGLVDLDLTPVLPHKTTESEGNEIVVTHEIPLNDPYLGSGEYRLQAVAYFNGRLKHEYRNIQYNGLDKMAERVVVAEYNGPQQTRIHLYTPGFSHDSSFVIPHNYSLANSIPSSSLYCFIRQEPSVIYAFSGTSFKLSWTVQIPLPHPRVNHAVSGKLLFVSTGNGHISGYDGAGSVAFLTPDWKDFSAGIFAVNDTYLVSEMISFSGSNRLIGVFYINTGSEKNRRNILYDILSILPSEEEFLIIRDLPGGYGISSLEPEEMTITELNLLNERSFRDAVPWNGDSYLVLDDAGLLEYDRYFNRFTVLLDTEATSITLNEVSGEIILGTQKGFNVYEPFGLELVYSEELEGNLMGIEILYNK